MGLGAASAKMGIRQSTSKKARSLFNIK
jgi:hypothetical protein